MSRLLLFLILAPQVVCAEQLAGLGFTANVPKQTLGGVIVYSWTYADVKVSRNFVGIWRDTYENISVREAVYEFGDSLINSARTHKTVDAGLRARLSYRTTAYLGLGVTETRHLYQFLDDFRILGRNGQYWVEHEVDYGINVNGGVFLRVAGPLHGQIGFNTNPRGLDLGVAIILGSP
ncbi:MAG TPA: hypothetical protein PLE60_08035 [Candidatus Latescibacteria bacterium]|nr:hypothetical protein [Candidatus Latescibacterota bacterium]